MIRTVHAWAYLPLMGRPDRHRMVRVLYGTPAAQRYERLWRQLLPNRLRLNLKLRTN